MLTLDTQNKISINGRDTGLRLSQHKDKTLIYTPEILAVKPHWTIVRVPTVRNEAGIMQWQDSRVYIEGKGQPYKAHTMPYNRYSSAHDQPRKPGAEYDPEVCAGRQQLEDDILKLLAKL